MNSCHRVFVRTHRRHAKSGSSCKPWASGVNDVSVSAHDCSTCTTVVRCVRGGEDSACGKIREYTGTLCTLHWRSSWERISALRNTAYRKTPAVSILSVEDSPGAERAIDGLQGRGGGDKEDRHLFRSSLLQVCCWGSVSSCNTPSNLWIRQFFPSPVILTDEHAQGQRRHPSPGPPD